MYVDTQGADYLWFKDAFWPPLPSPVLVAALSHGRGSSEEVCELQPQPLLLFSPPVINLSGRHHMHFYLRSPELKSLPLSSHRMQTG